MIFLPCHNIQEISEDTRKNTDYVDRSREFEVDDDRVQLLFRVKHIHQYYGWIEGMFASTKNFVSKKAGQGSLSALVQQSELTVFI